MNSRVNLPDESQYDHSPPSPSFRASCRQLFADLRRARRRFPAGHRRPVRASLSRFGSRDRWRSCRTKIPTSITGPSVLSYTDRSAHQGGATLANSVTGAHAARQNLDRLSRAHLGRRSVRGTAGPSSMTLIGWPERMPAGAHDETSDVVRRIEPVDDCGTPARRGPLQIAPLRCILPRRERDSRSCHPARVRARIHLAPHDFLTCESATERRGTAFARRLAASSGLSRAKRAKRFGGDRAPRWQLED